jgi:hypothetical protein
MGVSFVLGGTGMLRAALMSLADQSGRLVSISRSTRLSQVHPAIEDMQADFARSADINAIISRINAVESVTYGLIWMHSQHHPAARSVIEALLDKRPVAVAQVFGTSTSTQAMAPQSFRDEFGSSGAYVTVELGRMGSRWLTDEEISAGALTALLHKRDVVVGRL